MIVRVQFLDASHGEQVNVVIVRVLQLLLFSISRKISVDTEHSQIDSYGPDADSCDCPESVDEVKQSKSITFITCPSFAFMFKIINCTLLKDYSNLNQE